MFKKLKLSEERLTEYNKSHVLGSHEKGGEKSRRPQKKGDEKIN